jgi:transposase
MKTSTSTLLYIVKSFRDDNGKGTTKIIEKLGTVEEVKNAHPGEDPYEYGRRRAIELTLKEKEESREIMITVSSSRLIDNNKQRSYNGGYLFIQKVYNELGLDRICANASRRHKNEYNLNSILSMLLYTRVLYPGSKLSSMEDAKRFIEQPEGDIHQVYRALSLLAEESDSIQAAVYKNSLKQGAHRTKVLYYDCTNYYFETEEAKGLRQYGASKEHRPNPIVQMGMFMDMDGIPLAFCINPGNTNEQVTLKPLEDKLKEDFGISKVVVCTDCGLSSYENRKNDNIQDRAFITVQSLKKLKNHLQEWSLETAGWHTAGSDNTYDISTIDSNEHYDTLFYKDRWVNENGLEQRLIVTFSFKYRDYLGSVRKRQIERAESIVRGGASRVNRKNGNDCRRYIDQVHYTMDGEVAQAANYSINQEMIGQEARFDGFYAICTDLEDSPLDIIRANGGRWIIENGFRIMKTDFDARPVFLQRDDRIKAHFLTCFLALLLYKYLEKKVNRGTNHFTPNNIINTLINMNFLSVPGEGYVPTYTRTKLTNALHGSAGFRTDTQIVTKKQMRNIIASTKK